MAMDKLGTGGGWVWNQIFLWVLLWEAGGVRCPIALSSSIFSASLLYNCLRIPGSNYPQPALWSTSDLCSHFAVPFPNFNGGWCPQCLSIQCSKDKSPFILWGLGELPEWACFHSRIHPRGSRLGMLAQPSALWQAVPSVFLKLSCFFWRGRPCSQQIAVLLASQVNPGNVGVALEKATQRYQGREGTT